MIDTLQQQIDMLQRRIERLEQNQILTWTMIALVYLTLFVVVLVLR